MSWQLRPQQKQVAQEALILLVQHHIAYLAMEERTGKTLSAIHTAELVQQLYGPIKVIVATKPKALTGWKEALAKYEHELDITLTTHMKLKNYGPDYDLMIFDEAHNNISGYPKPSAVFNEARRVSAKCKWHIFMSATPHAQGPQQMFHQLGLSKYSPWRQYKNFYQWFKKYGKPFTIEIQGVDVPQYTRTIDEVWDDFEHLMISYTRAEMGFEHEPEDSLHYVELHDDTKYVYNTLAKKRTIVLSVGRLVADTASKLRYALHMLEGGTVKIDGDYFTLRNREKIDYILEQWGDTEDMVIMYNYIQEGVKLREVFKKAEILQATSNAEGVDLMHKKHLIIYSQDFSTARHTQRRCRQANMDRKEPIVVHYLLVRKAISDRVYEVVSRNKKNFVDRVFERI